MSDLTCLAEGLVFPADFATTGLNCNELVVGPTGCGKSFSNAYSRLLHTTESSIVVPISKKAIRDRFAGMFQQRGYQVIDLDFTHPEQCTVGYDPLDYVHTDEDVVNLARNVILGTAKDATISGDPYWNEAAISVHAAEIALVRLWGEERKEKVNYGQVIKLHKSMRVSNNDGLVRTSLDRLFMEAEDNHPGNQATAHWKAVQGLSEKTASCIFSILNTAMDKIFNENIVAMTQKRSRISFSKLGKRKTVVFITTSPINQTLQNFVNILYADLFRSLFETAEGRADYRLKVPVHIICDDFACGSRIHKFEDYISIFRAAGISVTLLLQSESQLESMYGETEATTIINNCDTYVYMGGMDILTCEHIAKRVNKPLSKVMAMEKEKVYVFRRGAAPVEAKRYQTLNDPLYQELLEGNGKLRVAG